MLFEKPFGKPQAEVDFAGVILGNSYIFFLFFQIFNPRFNTHPLDRFFPMKEPEKCFQEKYLKDFL